MKTKEELDVLFADLQETARTCARYWVDDVEDDDDDDEGEPGDVETEMKLTY